MAYQALYRTWRPMVFDDVAGQEHITKTLRNEIKTGNLAHAYLFCGTRGTGKTSTAKIFARAVNCLHPIDGNPCNECDICKGILDDSILDVVEMDGASRNKVEHIRDLIDNVAFLPSRARKKVYIIDEVHMVTTNAFNALLKTLEEPPEHVLFILATTELNKIPPTVLSRCQRFDFKRITQEAIAERLSHIVSAAGREVAPEAIGMIAELGDGSMRDALSVLEQVLGYTEGPVSFNDMLSIIGMTDYDALFSVCRAFCDGDGGAALSVFDQVIENGKEPEVFISRLIRFLRDLLVVKLTKNPQDMLNTSAEQLAKMKELVKHFSGEKLIYALKVMNEAVASAKNSGFGRTVYELALVKLSNPVYESSLEALSARMADLEQKLSEGITVVAAPSAAATQADETWTPMEADALPWDEEPKAEIAEKPAAEETKEETQSAPTETVSETASCDGDNENAPVLRFEEIKGYVRMHGGAPVMPHLGKAKPMMLSGKLSLVFTKDAMMSKNIVARPGNMDLLKKAILEILGREVSVQCLSDKEAGVEDEGDGFDKLLALGAQHSGVEII